MSTMPQYKGGGSFFFLSQSFYPIQLLLSTIAHDGNTLSNSELTFLLKRKMLCNCKKIYIDL